jgi:hypothetical protein
MNDRVRLDKTSAILDVSAWPSTKRRKAVLLGGGITRGAMISAAILVLAAAHPNAAPY